MWGLTIALLLVIVTLWIIWRNRRFSILKNMGVPGPEPSIFFGNMWQLASKSPPLCMEEWLQKYGNVTGYYFGVHPMVLVSDPDILKKIQVSEFQKYINRPAIFQSPMSKPGDGFTAQLTNLRDRRWKEIRSTITPSFTTSKMRTMTPIINSALDILMQDIDDKAMKGECFDIYKMYQGLTMDVIGRTAFGIQTDCQRNPNDPLLRSCKVLFAGDIRSLFPIFQFSFPELQLAFIPYFLLHLWIMNKGVNPITQLLSSVRHVIQKRRESSGNRRQDLLQLMIDAQVSESDVSKATAEDLTAGDDNPHESGKAETTDAQPNQMNRKGFRNMSNEEILDNAVMFFLAGYETTSTALGFTTHLLLHHPEVQERVRDEVKDLVEREGKLDYSSVQKLQYLDQVLNESLRLYPPIYLFVSREVGEDVNLGGVQLKKGVGVQVPVYNLQRDERYWPEPNKFDPERFSPENKSRNHPFAFQAFGAGPRNCVGIRLAQMEAKLILARILLKYRLEKCEKTDKLHLALKTTAFTLAPRNGVNLKAIPLQR